MKFSIDLKLILAAAIFACGMTASATEVTWVAGEQGYTNAEDVTGFTIDDNISVTLAQNDGTNGPKYYTSGSTLRLYPKNTMTITSKAEPITKVVLTLQAANPGTWTTDDGTLSVVATTGTWTGSANTVVLTNGSKGFIQKISVVYGEEAGPVEPEDVIYSNALVNDDGGFITNDVSLSDGLSYVWKNNNYGWVASAYASSAAHEAESWLISPGFNIDEGSTATLSFQHALNKGTRDAASVHVSLDKETWTELDVPNWPAGTDWNFLASGDIDLSSFAGKTIYIGFKYASTTSNAPSWEIQAFLLKGKGSVKENEVETPVYKTIAEAKAASTAAQVKSTLQLTNVTVAFVKGSSTYITDGTDGFLLYGSSIGLATGQNVDITVTGNLYLYNGLPELAVTSVDEAKVNSEDNAVEPVVVEIADIVSDKLKYSSMLVKIEETGVEEEEWNSRNVTLIQDGEEAILRDNWSVATDLTFKTDKDYNITGFVAIYNDNVQIYPRTADDIQLLTSQATPASKWMNGEEEIAVLTVSDLTADLSGVKFTTDSDGAVTFSSSNENVATVSDEGVITLVGAGKTEIKAVTAETENFQASSTTLNVAVIILEGDGTEENPYTVTDLTLLYDEAAASEPVWVKGYIVGCLNGAVTKPAWTTDSENVVATNVLFSDNAEADNVDNCVPVALPTETASPGVRAKANLVDHPENLGKMAKAYGTIEKYFSVAGLKNVTQIIIEGEDVAIPGDVNEDGEVDIKDVVAVINHIAGTASYKNANVNGDKDDSGNDIVDINDVVAVINIMAGNATE